MRFLILSGTAFLGYHAAAEALEASHDVPAFTREGKAPLHGVEPLRGDLFVLRGREWDAVLDTFPDLGAVGETARLPFGSVGTYGYVSGISNYHPDVQVVVDRGGRNGRLQPGAPHLGRLGSSKGRTLRDGRRGAVTAVGDTGNEADQPRHHQENALPTEPILLSAGFSRESGV